MISKLYKKLYFYALAILIVSILLTLATVGVILHLNQKNFFKEHFINESIFIQKVLKQINSEYPEKLKPTIDEISKELKWSISYWKDNKVVFYSGKEPFEIPNEALTCLKKDKQLKILNTFNPHPNFLTYLDETKPEEGYLVLSFNNPFNEYPLIRPIFLGGFLILLFLSLLLIPYSLFIIDPFKKLIVSIKKVSQGDFSTQIIVNKNSEFTELADSFNNMTFKIQEMIQEKQRLIADVSHELRSPLTRMRVSMELLAKDPEGRKKYIQKTILEIEQLNKIIEDILDISKIELIDSTNLQLVNIINLVEENIEKNRLLFDEHKLKIITFFPAKEIFIKVDKMLMERVFNNIFSNALKYAPVDSKIDIFIEEKQDKILFSLRDYGIGIKPEEHEKIFDPFYRSDNSRSRKTGGTGLGLAIVKKIISIHNGKVWTTSPQTGNGFIVNFELMILIL